MTKPLFIFEFANNHMGDPAHGVRMISEYADIIKDFDFDFAVKFQFRDLDTFIHPDFKDRTDLKYVKRFSETKLDTSVFQLLKNNAEQSGFKTICTGFDEKSVERIVEMGFDYIKIASCSFTDWPLLNKIAEYDLPVIASTAGASLQEIDNVVSFFTNRKKTLSIMHCIGQYPTVKEELQINQIDLLKNRYPHISVGFSTHEEPDNFDSIKIAIAKGALLFEKHVAVETDLYTKNAYSATPSQVKRWLQSASDSLSMCGVQEQRHTSSDKEVADLRQFKRGVFAKRRIEKGEIIDRTNVFYAWPPQDDQILANDMSKYTYFLADKTYEPNEAVYHSEGTKKINTREKIWNIVQDVNEFIREANVIFPPNANLEISHHYGINRFYEAGIAMITVVNREYCKKLIIALPGQTHPAQYHKRKEETFVVLHGDVVLELDGIAKKLTKGEVITIEPGVVHQFSTENGCIIEEISSTHYKEDSYYIDPIIGQNKNRKTFIPHWVV